MTLLLLLVGAPVIWYFLNGNSFGDIRSKAAPATNLRFSTTNTSAAVGQQITIQIIAETNENKIGQIRPAVKFDPAYLKAISMSQGTFLTNFAKADAEDRLDNTTGIISAYFYGTQPVSGTGPVATVTFETKKAGQTTLRFDTTSVANASGEVNAGTSTASNVIIGMAPLTITIGSGTLNASTISPTITPIPTPTGGATITVTPNPTTTLGATPIPTITRVPTPTTVPSSTVFDISTPTEAENFKIDSPTFTGIGDPGSSVTLVLYSSETTTAIASTSGDGVWEYTPETPLADGQYSLSATYAGLDGTTDVLTRTFTVTVSDPPVTGNEVPVIILLVAVSFLISSGVYILRFSRA